VAGTGDDEAALVRELQEELSIQVGLAVRKCFAFHMIANIMQQMQHSHG
jgi:8-oxo-dGTP pyrophosphatase MutT (NUDIX family)